MSPIALVAGASGLVGRQLLEQLLADPQTAQVHAVLRRALASQPPRLRQVLVAGFDKLPALPPADEAYCALGTTIKQAGSQAAFRAVDHNAVLAFARAAQAAGVRRLGVVSALGADARSSVFYNRVKGETEAALAALGFERLVIARPSLLMGDRQALGQPLRPMERLGMAVTGPLGGLIPARWRPIHASVVARALLRALRQPGTGTHVLESAALQTLGRPGA
jgi:uncharacterized protein YbjT (DUF2867 family)